MKILWIVNTIFPYPAKELGIEKTAFGGWLNGLAENLKEHQNINLAIASPYCGKEMRKYFDGKVTYYLFPNISAFKYNSDLDYYAKNILEEFNPDILHIHGTEYAHGVSFLNTCQENVKKIVSIQGLTTCIAKMYLAGMNYKDIIKSITLRDILKRDNLFQQANKFRKKAEYEKYIIRKSDYIIGRTDWDKYNSKAINNKVKYFSLPEVVRKEFYENKWEINNIERHSLYLSQGSYPIKGLHMLLEAIMIVKKQYPDVKLYVSGINILKNDTILDKIKFWGYGRYIKSLINKYDVKSNVEFTGILNVESVIQRLLKTHIVIVPSIVENESNSLTEAHLLGIPTIAAFSGGMTERIIHKRTGFLYPYFEPNMCAGYIMRYFDNDSLAIKYGEGAREVAKVRNNPEDNTNSLVKIYDNILKGE